MPGVSRKHVPPLTSKTGSRVGWFARKVEVLDRSQGDHDARRQNSNVRALYVEQLRRESPRLFVGVDVEIEPRH
ncbi:hypothetical protein B0G69_6479 [Paraburkholderia sp. RAU2J]|nr:hypothetical protein B0G69_6479 [Paraburkholderia sp. RAU2J]